MQKLTPHLTRRMTLAVLLGSLAFANAGFAAEEGAAPKPVTGKDIAFDNAKGNCLACHMIAGGDQPGTVGPPLVAMKARYPDRQALFDVIWDPRNKFGQQTIMPPMGAHGILSKEDIEKVVDFIQTL
jgi:sulfur-oxidizing protein SoxX